MLTRALRGVTLVGQQLSWTPNTTGPSTITLTATDGRGGQATQVIQLNVLDAPPPSGNPPQFRSLPPKETPLGQSLNYRADAFDPEGTNVRYALTRGAVGMSINAENGLLSWRPEQLGQVAIEITATDEAGERAVQVFTLTVIAGSVGNQAPVITSSPRGPAARNLLYQYPVQARDPEGDTLTYSLDAGSLARGMTITTAGLIEWLPTSADSLPVIISVRDALGATTQQSFTLSVLGNAPPQITSTAPQRLELGQTLSYTVTANDPNPGDSITYAASTMDGLTINPQTGVLTFRPTAAGRVTFSVFATDNHQARDEQFVELLVVDPANNRPPQIDGAPRSSIQFGVDYLCKCQLLMQMAIT